VDDVNVVKWERQTVPLEEEVELELEILRDLVHPAVNIFEVESEAAPCVLLLYGISGRL
jgi:hypothetical protein